MPPAKQRLLVAAAAALLCMSVAVGGPAGSEVAAPPPPQAPRQLRLSLGDTPGTLVVKWSTAEPTAESCAQLIPAAAAPRAALKAPQHSSAAAALGLLPGGGVPAGAAQPETFSASVSRRRLLEALQGAPAVSRTLCGRSSPFVEPATNATTQWLHEVALSQLAPGAQCLYRVGSGAGGWSDWVGMTAPRAASQFSEERPASLLVVGDLGYYNSQTLPDLAREVAGGGYDALLHIGDLAYDLESLQGRRAAQFLAHIEPLASRLPYMVLAGNHEAHWNFSHYRELFAMPNRGAGEGFFYSFDVGPLHVLAYNTEVFYWPESFGLGSMRRMHEWMEADLQAVDRSKTPWILVAGHRPMYCVMTKGGACDWGWSRDHEASRLGIPSRCSPRSPLLCPPTHTGGNATFPIEALLHKYGVDIAVYGHSHCYEAYQPVFNLTVQPGGRAAAPGGVYLDPHATIHVTSGSGGNSEMRRGADPPPSGPCNGTAPWCAFQSGFAPTGQQSADYSYSRVRAFNATHLLWEQYSSTLGRMVDAWWLVQRRHGPFGSGVN